MSSVIKKVLIVEDEEYLRQALEKKFELAEFDVSTARDGEEGLKMALEIHPDLILLDILMPKMDGMKVMEKLRQDSWGKDVKIILLTNVSPDDELLQKINQYNPSFYLIKSDSELSDLVAKAKGLLST